MIDPTRDRSMHLFFKRTLLFFSLTSYILFLTSLMGCIRLVGSAGYSYQGKGDEAPKTKAVTLDTDDVIHPNSSKGSIEGL